MALQRGLAPIEGPAARILVLGSFPGARSLAAREYYAHPQNRFWRTVGTALDEPVASGYTARTTSLRAHRIALWDVLGACGRRGSLDSAIAPGSEVPNDLGALVGRHPELRRILINGRKAADLFTRFIVPDEFWPDLGLDVRVMPSTSPANARDIAGQLRDWCAALRD